jgi:hypothetical protein
MLKTKFFMAATAIVLVACSQPDPIMTISPEPIYNKMGEVTGCRDSSLVPNSTWENPCEPPDDCVIIPGTNYCDPAGGRDPNDGRGSDDAGDPGGGRNPTGSPTTG